MHRLWVGNLPWIATEDDIVGFFSPVCRPRRIRIMLDQDTGKPRGFAFVDLGSAVEVAMAVEKLNRTDLMGRSIFVNVANERPVGQKPQARETKPAPKRNTRFRHDHNHDSDW